MLATIPSSSQTIWECALACALRRGDARCFCRFGDSECSECKFYIRKYSNADDRAVQLLMVQAECEASGIKRTNRRHHFGYAVWLTIFLVLAYVTWNYEQKHYARPAVQRSNYEYQATYPDTSIEKSSTNTSEHANIDKTLRLVTEQFRKKPDVNNDKLTNCIDAAVLFYQYYPDKSKVCIEINYNPDKDFHHLFNCVYTDGVWKAIEPQAYWVNASSYWMWSVWGDKYDKKYNCDETEKWKKYVK